MVGILAPRSADIAMTPYVNRLEHGPDVGANAAHGWPSYMLLACSILRGHTR